MDLRRLRRVVSVVGMVPRVQITEHAKGLIRLFLSSWRPIGLLGGLLFKVHQVLEVLVVKFLRNYDVVLQFSYQDALVLGRPPRRRSLDCDAVSELRLHFVVHFLLFSSRGRNDLRVLQPSILDRHLARDPHL